MREIRSLGSVEGVVSNGRPYSDLGGWYSKTWSLYRSHM